MGCFYPRHPRGWRHGRLAVKRYRLNVSIHATLAGGDFVDDCAGCALKVSIHATLAGGDCGPPSFFSGYRSFYPRHPRGWRPPAFFCCASIRLVSIHATLAGGDRNAFIAPGQHVVFLSTPPSRVATAKVYKNVQCLLRKREKIICKIKNNLKHPPHIPIATSKKCTACPKTSDGIGAKLLGKVCLLSPRTGAATQAAHHPEQIRGGGQGAPRGFCSGCQAGKSAGCRFRGQSARPARL